MLKTVEMTWFRAIKIWWFWAWRVMLAATVVGVVVGVLIGIFFTPFIRSEEVLMLSANLVGAFIGIYFGIFVLRTLPEKRFSDFHVVLVANDQGATSPNRADHEVL